MIAHQRVVFINLFFCPVQRGNLSQLDEEKFFQSFNLPPLSEAASLELENLEFEHKRILNQIKHNYLQSWTDGLQMMIREADTPEAAEQLIVRTVEYLSFLHSINVEFVNERLVVSDQDFQNFSLELEAREFLARQARDPSPANTGSLEATQMETNLKTIKSQIDVIRKKQREAVEARLIHEHLRNNSQISQETHLGIFDSAGDSELAARVLCSDLLFYFGNLNSLRLNSRTYTGTRDQIISSLQDSIARQREIDSYPDDLESNLEAFSG